MNITSLEVNGRPHTCDADPERTLSSVLRDDVGLTGTKYGCGEGQCGACAIVNPKHLVNQNEGAIVQGRGGALFEAVHFEAGRILNRRFAQYRPPRFRDTPKIETVLVNRTDLPSAGAGECPIVGIAPAVANAICDATGKRLRSLPLVPNGLSA